MRGNHGRSRGAPRPSGSIPARAGEPCKKMSIWTHGRVYPRTCGGTETACNGDPRQQGLSPHVRGNLDRKSKGTHPTGSIPARAGEPRRSPTPTTGPGVYPRTCGGTVGGRAGDTRCLGLSPHVRGNPHTPIPTTPREGSIPARAGEPRLRRPSPRCLEVYPRTCGGTCSEPWGT